jgi:hypothetical protein
LLEIFIELCSKHVLSSGGSARAEASGELQLHMIIVVTMAKIFILEI